MKKTLKPSSKLIQKRLNLLLSNVGDMALKRRAKSIILGLDLQPGDKVLDVGCGDGFYLHLLSSLGIVLQLFGSDFDVHALSVSRKRFKGRKIKFLKGDLMRKLPFDDNFFDKIVMSEVAEHLPNDIRGFKELHRVLNQGGVLCISVPSAKYPFVWDPVNWTLDRVAGEHIKSGFWAGFWFNHVRLYKKEDLEKRLSKSGFKIVKSYYLTWWALPFNHYIINIVARLLWGGRLSGNISTSLNKFEKAQKKPIFISLAFHIINMIDRLNDIFEVKDSGVGVFVKASK